MTTTSQTPFASIGHGVRSSVDEEDTAAGPSSKVNTRSAADRGDIEDEAAAPSPPSAAILEALATMYNAGELAGDIAAGRSETASSASVVDERAGGHDVPLGGVGGWLPFGFRVLGGGFVTVIAMPALGIVTTMPADAFQHALGRGA